MSELYFSILDNAFDGLRRRNDSFPRCSMRSQFRINTQPLYVHCAFKSAESFQPDIL